MNHVLVIEHDKQRKLQKITLKPGESISIGRAWQNKVIINDSYVDAYHLQISMDESGCIHIEDLNSKNGSSIGKKSVNGKLAYDLAKAITIGESTVTLYSAETSVAPALRRDSVQAASHKFSSFFWVGIASLLGCGGVFIQMYWLGESEVNTERLSKEFMSMLIVSLSWCVMAALVGKLFRNNTHGKLHWIFISSFFFLAMILVIVSHILAFNLDSNITDLIVTNTTIAGLGVFLVFGALSLCTRLGFKKKLASAVCLLVIPIGFDLMEPLITEEHELWKHYATVERTNLPPQLLFRKPETLEYHVRSTDSLFSNLDIEVAQGADPQGSLLGKILTSSTDSE